jgi:hypothetical protein
MKNRSSCYTLAWSFLLRERDGRGSGCAQVVTDANAAVIARVDVAPGNELAAVGATVSLHAEGRSNVSRRHG